MKLAAVLVMLLVGVPALARLIARAETARRVVVGVIAYGIFNLPDLNVLSDAGYTGDSRGFEVSLVDFLVLALYVAQRREGAAALVPRRFAWTRLAYLGAALLSLAATDSAVRSGYAIWKLLRMYLTFSVMAAAFVDLAMLQAALTGVAVGAVAQGALVLDQRYLQGAYRVTGSLPHPNTLAMLMNMVAPVTLALVLAGRGTRLAAVAFASAAVAEVLTLSRLGVALFALAVALTCAGSALRGVSVRKAGVVLAVAVGGLAVLYKSLDSLVQRFREAPPESALTREQFNAAARAMVAEHPSGVGINMFSYVLERGGYADRVGLVGHERAGIAHNIYLLTAAELGWVGLAAWVALIAAVYVAALRAARLAGVRGDVALGVLVGMTTMHLQGSAEWVARQTPMGYCFWIFAAIIAAALARPAPRAA